ncbi:MAG: hypothetical protein WA985_01970, partial [Erythrobacter sp.]
MEGIVQVLVGGLLALAGALIGPHFQRKHERWRADREDRELLRDKAEELFDELDLFLSESEDASVAAVARVQDDAVETKKVPDLRKVRAIATIYFPSSLELIEKYENDFSELMQWVVDESGKA